MPKLTPLRWFAILAILAGVLALGLPPDPRDIQQLQTTSAAYRLAIAVLLIPYVAAWFASFYAFAKLQEYSGPIKGSKDGEGFRAITLGMGVLSFALVIPTILSLLLNFIASHNRTYESTAIVLSNYLSIFPAIVAFLLLYTGARKLLTSTKTGTSKLDIRWHSLWFILLSVVFAYLTVENHDRANPYHLPIWALLVTFVVPYIYGWAMGFLSSYGLRLYANTVHGSMYARAIKRFALGITIAISGSVAIQFVNSALIHQFDDSLSAILLINYLLVAIVAVGLILMALGTKRLKLIEEA